MEKSARPPGPPLPAFAQSLLLLLHWPRFVAGCQKRYGDVFTLRIMSAGAITYLADPGDVKTVLGGSGSVYHAGQAAAPLRGLFGENSIVLLDGERHRRWRRAMMPTFHRDTAAHQAHSIAETTAASVAGWPVGVPFSVASKMSDITLEVILQSVFGATDTVRLTSLAQAIRPILDLGGFAFTGLVQPELQRLWPWRFLRRQLAHLDALLYSEIAACRTDPALPDRYDSLAALVRSALDEPTSDQVLRDQLITLIVAGHDTTSSSLAWAFERLVRHPRVLARAASAAQSGDAGDDYLDAVIKETLRVRPVIFDVRRTLNEPVEVAGYRLSAGALVSPGIGLMHRDPRLHPNPERFDPDRMIGDLAPSSAGLLPFGAGTRRCIGATFAMMEMRIVLGEVLRAVSLHSTAEADEKPKLMHTVLVPSRGGRIVVDARLNLW